MLGLDVHMEIGLAGFVGHTVPCLAKTCGDNHNFSPRTCGFWWWDLQIFICWKMVSPITLSMPWTKTSKVTNACKQNKNTFMNLFRNNALTNLSIKVQQHVIVSSVKYQNFTVTFRHKNHFLSFTVRYKNHGKLIDYWNYSWTVKK